MRILAFGFPFSEDRVSEYTGLTTGPGVVKYLAENVAEPLVLISSAASSYVDDVNIVPLLQSRTFKGSSRSVAPLGEDDWKAMAGVESVALEMAGRRFSQIKNAHGSVGTSSYYELRQVLRNKIAYWTEFVKQKSIDVYVNSNCPHLVDDLIAYEVCRLKGVPAIFPYRLPIVPGVMARLYIPESLYNHSECYGRNGELISADAISEEDARAPLPADLALIFNEVVLGEESLPSLSSKVLTAQEMEKPRQFIRPLVDRRLLGLKALAKALIRKDKSSYSTSIALGRLERENYESYRNLAKIDVPDNPFIYFPLHMQPEASSCPLGGMFSDQLRAVRLIASALPVGWKLLVKEHPAQQFCFRTPGWYKELASTPGVELISLEVSSSRLQERSRAVVTLTGAAAFEAWLKRKPGIVLGNILYQDAPGIYKVRTQGDALEAIEAILSGETHSIEDIRSYLGKLAVLSFPGHLDAYINPCIDSLTAPDSSNEKEIGSRLSAAIESARVRNHYSVSVT